MDVSQQKQQQGNELAQALITGQNFKAAVAAGAVAASLAAAIYAVVTTLWPFAYGFAAVGIGIGVGVSMQYLGRGVTTRFAVMAAVFTIAGCFLGNLFRAILQPVRENGSSIAGVIRANDMSVLVERAVAYISLIDLVFWGVAVWFSVFLVKRPLSRADRFAIGAYLRKE